jgi:hypothetical protein
MRELLIFPHLDHPYSLGSFPHFYSKHIYFSFPSLASTPQSLDSSQSDTSDTYTSKQPSLVFLLDTS